MDLRLSTSNFLNRGKSFIFLRCSARARAPPACEGRDTAYGFDIVYPNDMVSADFRRMTIGENYNPALGYVPRTGRAHHLSAGWSSDPGRSSGASGR